MEEKVTVYTLAEQLELSVSTVSRAFNPESHLSAETRRRVLEAAEACGYQPNKSASRLSRRLIRIGILVCGQIETYREAYYEDTLRGFRAAEEMLQNYKVQVDLRVFNTVETPREKMAEVLREFAENRVDGVITQGRLDGACVAVLRAMKELGIRVVTIQNANSGCDADFCSTVDTRTSAKIAAQLLAMLTRGSAGKVLVLTGSRTYFHHELLWEEFSRAAQKEGLNVLRSVDTQDDPVQAEILVEQAFREEPEINGIYITSANSATVCRYLEKSGWGKRVAVVATDLFSEMRQFLEHGTVDACIFQNPFEQARAALDALYRMIAENEEIPKRLLITPQIVLRSNLENFQKKEE